MALLHIELASPLNNHVPIHVIACKLQTRFTFYNRHSILKLAEPPMKKPLLNITNDANYEHNDNGPFKEDFFPISDLIGASKLGYSVMVIEPGFKACPFHNHHVNEEMFLVLSGSGSLRFGEVTYDIVADDIIACPPGGAEVAHQIINTGTEPLKVLCVSTNEPVDICEYPDSNKTLSMVGSQGQRRFLHMSRLDDKVDYFEGES